MARELLIVDDDPEMRKAIVLLLGGEYDFLEAGDGREALRLIAERSPRLILLDVAMPGMDGLDVLRAARPVLAQGRVVMLTGEADLGKARKALDMGACAYITKPFDNAFLRSEIQRLMKPAETRPDGGRPWRIA